MLPKQGAHGSTTSPLLTVSSLQYAAQAPTRERGMSVCVLASPEEARLCAAKRSGAPAQSGYIINEYAHQPRHLIYSFIDVIDVVTVNV